MEIQSSKTNVAVPTVKVNSVGATLLTQLRCGLADVPHHKRFCDARTHDGAPGQGASSAPTDGACVYVVFRTDVTIWVQTFTCLCCVQHLKVNLRTPQSKL